jgi:hypothetical protein
MDLAPDKTRTREHAASPPASLLIFRCFEWRQASRQRSLSASIAHGVGDRVGDHAIGEIGPGRTIAFAQPRARVIAKLSDQHSSWLVATRRDASGPASCASAAEDVMSSPSGVTCRDLLSSSAERVRAGFVTVELEEAPCEHRDGTRSTSRTDQRRMDRHRERRGAAHAPGAGGQGRCAEVLVIVRRPGARGGVGGDDGLAVRGRGALPGRCGGASG